LPLEISKPLIETSYLTAQNVGRYRAIMRFFYDQYQHLRYWLRPEDVYDGVLALATAGEYLNEFGGYTPEQCQKDLDALVTWKNLVPRHDGGHSNSIEEYLRKRFRYQMTPYAVEIERMVAGLEKLRGFGGSLEPSHFEEIASALLEIETARGNFAPGKALNLWRVIYQAFDNLTRGAADYIASLQTNKAEELMLTETFLVYKSSLTSYLQDFVKGLQREAPRIEATLRKLPGEYRSVFFSCLQADQAAVPQLDEEPLPEEEQIRRIEQDWDNIIRWFCGTGGQRSEVTFLEQRTRDTITRVVHYARRIQERQQSGLSRRHELEHLGLWFFSLTDINTAHTLAANAFGLYRARRFQGMETKSTESTGISMWEEPPNRYALRSRSRQRLRDNGVTPIISKAADIERARSVHFQEQEYERALLHNFLAAGKVRISDMQTIDPLVRNRLLSWIGACHANKSRRARIAEGVVVKVENPADECRAVLHSSDGDLEMPDYTLHFQSLGNTEGRIK
jgi:uncharacterized protein (TIGR02677 family)